MAERQHNLNKFEYKTIAVHGLCKCGAYYQGSLSITPLLLSLPHESKENVTVHFVLQCWKCNRLVNLVSIEKEPLKNKSEA